MDAYDHEASVRRRRISRCSKYEGIGKVSNNSVGRYGIEGWMDGWMALVSFGRSGGRMKLKVGHATQLPPLKRGKPFLTYLTFIIHAPCSGETRGGKRAELFHCRRSASPLCHDLACRKRRASPSFLRMRRERHECQSDVKASQFNSGLRP